MAKFTKDKFKSINQDWETPLEIFEPLNREFNFSLDVCASIENAKCKKYFTLEDDALSKEWDGVCWMNPPYFEIKKWMQKAYSEFLKGKTVVCFIPSRTNTAWWHEICMKGEIRFIKGRPIFKGAKYGLPQPLAIVIFRPQ